MRKRNAGEEVQDQFKDAAWNGLRICQGPEDPNFHQVAGLLAYGPLALGKGQHCPRDGRPGCSIVDALEATSCLDLVLSAVSASRNRPKIELNITQHIFSISIAYFERSCTSSTVLLPATQYWQGKVEGPHGSCPGSGATSSQPCSTH